MTDPKHLENWLHEKAGLPARAVTPDQVRYTLAELLTEAEVSKAYPLPPEEREWVDTPAVGREVLSPFDAAEHLTSTEAVAALLADAEVTGDPAYIEHARQVASRAKATHGIK